MKARFDHVEEIARDIKTFWFQPERQLRYQAGQFIELRLPHDKPDRRGDKRWFTLSSSPTEHLVSITTRFASSGGSSFKHTLANLEPGDEEIWITDAMGDFVLPKNAERKLVFVAGGIGCTPMRSMIKSLADSEEKRSVHMIYAANKLEEVAFRELLEAYCDHFEVFLTDPPKDWVGKKGRIDSGTIVDYIKTQNLDDPLIYLSGPEPMVESLDKGLKASGINKRSIATDFFPNYSAI